MRERWSHVIQQTRRDGSHTLANYACLLSKRPTRFICRHAKSHPCDYPNHIQQPFGKTVGTECDSVPTDITKSGIHYGSISKIIKSFKHEFTKTIRCLYGNYQFRWKRSFHDRIIRDERELNIKRNYIKNNPGKWWQARNNKAPLVRVESHSTLTNPVGVLPLLPTYTLPRP